MALLIFRYHCNFFNLVFLNFDFNSNQNFESVEVADLPPPAKRRKPTREPMYLVESEEDDSDYETATASTNNGDGDVEDDDEFTDHDEENQTTDDETNDDALNFSIESDAEEMATKKKRQSNEWEQKGEFESFAEAEKFVKSLGLARFDRKCLNLGTKTYYRCNKIRRDAKIKCYVQVYILAPNDTSGYQIWFNLAEHNHVDSAKTKKGKFSPELLDFVINSANNNHKPKRIIREINKMREETQQFQNDVTPTSRQIHYLLAKHREKETPPIISIGELVEWCEGKSAIPEDQDEAFVLAEQHSKHKQNMYFRFVLSTIRLLQNAANVTNICVDATYKLNWCGFPLLLLGTIDLNKSFHLIAIACCSNEKQADFSFLFQTVRETANDLLGFVLEPEIMIADAADAIRNAFFESFPESAKTDIMCYAHVVRNVKKRSLNEKTNRTQIISDMHILHLSKNEELFRELSELFLAKWEVNEAEFVAYFQQYWLGRHCNWFEGKSAYTPTHNNACESINNVIKNEVTERKRLPFGQFVSKMCSLCNDFSTDYKQKTKIMATEPDVSLKDIREAAVYADKIKKLIETDETTDTHFNCVLKSHRHETSRRLNAPSFAEVNSKEFANFDDYVSNGFNWYYEVSLAKNKAKWKTESSCTCKSFQKNYHCIHVTGLALHKRVMKCPKKAIPTELNKKAKSAGRKPMATLALMP